MAGYEKKGGERKNEGMEGQEIVGGWELKRRKKYNYYYYYYYYYYYHYYYYYYHYYYYYYLKLYKHGDLSVETDFQRV